MSLRNVLIATASIAVCAASLPCHATVISIPQGTVDVFVGNSNGTPNSIGRAMFANFTPKGGKTLSQAAAAAGYIGFDWLQTITNWPNADLRRHNGTLIVPVPPNSPFRDPPAGGYNYNPCGGPASGASGTASPFYFNPKPSTDCWSLTQNEPTPATLSFGDEPMDHRLTSAQVAADNVPKFTTDLVGILPGKIPGPVLFFWTWQTTYNGSAGEISSRSANSPMLQPGSGGTGHVTITGFGVPIPEPRTLSLLLSGVFAMFASRTAADWRKTRYERIRVTSRRRNAGEQAL